MDSLYEINNEPHSEGQSGQSPINVATPSSRCFRQNSSSAPSEQNPRPGFFAGASHVDASHGVFTDVAGDLHINIEMKGNVHSLLNQLPRAKNAGYLSAHHRRCLLGTRIAELQRIEKWEADCTEKRVYWLSGVTGSGKSTIAQTFAERSSARGQLGASFFCSRDFPDRRDIHLIFPTLAFVLAYRYTQFREALIKVMTLNPDAAHESLAIQLEILLIRPLKSSSLSTTIVIDALDECEDNEPASAILSLLARHIDAIPFVKFFVTGRPELQIRSGFRLPLLQPHTEAFVLHSVDPLSVNHDIELYLRTRLSEIAAERSHWDLTVPWPADDDIAPLVERCSGLFIVAYIFIRLIGDHHLEPQEQLKVIIKEANSTIRVGRSGVDGTYHQVFLRSFADVDILDSNFFDLLRLVVGSVVLVFTPLSCADLAKILDIPSGRVRSTIRLLHSVLMVPNSDTEDLRICHKSFADFLTDPDRCIDKRFYINPFIQHKNLGMGCLRLMNASLKNNICDLPSYAMNEDIGDLDARREKHIGGGLEYACRSWAKHLRFASQDGDNVGHIIESLEVFFKHHLLAWLEVLSVMGDVRCAVYSLRDAREWFVNVGSPDQNLLDIMKDGERFVLRFFDVIEVSACHIYHSALPWSPRSSFVRALYQDQISTEVKMLNAIDDFWDACTRTIQIRGSVSFIAFSHKGDLIAIGEDGCVEVFETSTGYRRATLALANTAFHLSLAFLPGDTLLATGRSDGVVDMWDLQTGGLVSSLEGHSKGVHSVAFSPCGTMLASCSDDHTVRIWDVSSRDCRCVLEGHSSLVQSVCWSATRKEVISGSDDRTVRVWDSVKARCVKTLTGNVGKVQSVACSPDSSFIASGSSYEVKIFNTQTGEVSRTISTDGLVLSIRYLDHDTLMYATEESTFVVQDLAKNATIPTPASKNVLKRCFQMVLTGFELFQRPKDNPTEEAKLFMFKYQGDMPSISSDKTVIASRIGNAVNIWQTDITSLNHETANHSHTVYSVAFSGDGRLVASGSSDLTAKCWDPTTGRCLGTFNHSDIVTSVAFSLDSSLLASGTLDDTIRIWNIRTHNLTSTLKRSFFRALHRSLAFSPNGEQLASLWLEFRNGVSCMNLDLWEVATGECLASMKIDMSIRKVAFDVDGTSVILDSSYSVTWWRISPIQSSVDGASNNHSSLPFEFIPLRDTKQSVPSHISPHLYRYPQRSGWILDEQERRVLWVPPDLRGTGDSYGKMVVLGSLYGKVPIIDFSDV